MCPFFSYKQLGNQNGAVAIIAGICMFMLIGFAALSIDIGNLMVARNELQNAADAGALAGARYLYINEGADVNPGANQIALDAATANKSQKTAVEVNWTGGNTGDVQRGHYCFANDTFTPNESLLPVDLWDVSDAELDANTDFINAVRVVTRRQANPVTTFFAGIFGVNSMQSSAEAIAYIGFAGSLQPQDTDQPLAICSEALRVNGAYTCSIGRMINSGSNVASSETGGWTSYNQDDPCSGGTNANEMNGLICTNGNPEPIALGQDIATNGGEIQSAFKSFYDCWVQNSVNKTQPWTLTLPVVECPGNNIGPCQRVVGAVTLTIIWINEQNDPQYTNAPYQMGGWASSDPNGQNRWASFVEAYNLQNLSADSETGLEPAPYAQKSIYFLPDCSPHEPRGTTGGQNFGILAEIPVLVR